MIIQLTRKQMGLINTLMKEYSDAEEIVIKYEYGCPIGTNVYASIRYCGYKQYEIDITDYESW